MLKTLAAYLEGYKKYALLAPLFVILEVVCELILPRVMAKIVDVGIETGDVPYIVAMGAVMVVLAALVLINLSALRQERQLQKKQGGGA